MVGCFIIQGLGPVPIRKRRGHGTRTLRHLR
jgi:hypothetical protein